MELEISFLEIQNCLLSLRKIANYDLNVLTAWKIRKIINLLLNELKEIEEIKKDLIKKYDIKIKADGTIDLNENNSNLEKFKKDIFELYTKKIKLNLSQDLFLTLTEISEVKLSAIDLENISFIMKEEEKKEN